MPSSPINSDKLKIARDIQLTAEQFYLPRKVKMIIGADLCPYLIRPVRVICGDNHPVLQETSLGWILLGRLQDVVHCIHEERAAENHFIKTTVRDHTGRFIARLHRLPNHAPLSDSYKNAEQIFLQLEKKWSKKSQLREYYTNFMKEYSQLGHMRPVCS
jgi:hypothetical protein